jgi:nitrogen-specific signal transduction histidine kinase
MQQRSSDQPRVRDGASAQVVIGKDGPATLGLVPERALATNEELVDVGAVLEAALQRAAGELAPRVEVTCEFDSQLRVLAEPEQLCLVFLNLLLMAARRMDVRTGASNGLRIAGWRTAVGRTVVEISDSGPPIPANQLAQLFDAHPDGAAPGAPGLSLAASQQAVSARGGIITVKSEPGGTSFRVELPTADR